MFRRSVFSSGIVVILLATAILLGYVTDLLWTRADQYFYPTDFSEQVTAYAEQYDLDAYVIYAMIKELSNFSSNHISDGDRIGLMQLSEETFLWLTSAQLEENLDPGLLYDPTTNIRYGCYYLLYLTTRYESWDAVFAAYLCGEDTVDPWYTSWLNDSEDHTEFNIPDDKTRQKVSKIQRTVEKYKKLYKQKGDVVS